MLSGVTIFVEFIDAYTSLIIQSLLILYVNWDDYKKFITQVTTDSTISRII